RLTQGECIPVSSAIRLRGIPPNASFMAFGVVPSFCSSSNSPASFSTQYQLDRSPRSNPIVSFCSEKFLICFAAAVLTFFIAGLLYLLCFKHVDNLGAYSIPSETGLLIPSGYANYPRLRALIHSADRNDKKKGVHCQASTKQRKAEGSCSKETAN